VCGVKKSYVHVEHSSVSGSKTFRVSRADRNSNLGFPRSSMVLINIEVEYRTFCLLWPYLLFKNRLYGSLNGRLLR
jgi:hypothetical protein